MGQSNITELVMNDDVTGSGNEAVAGRQVTVHYTGWLYDQAKADHKGRSSTAHVIATSRSRFALAADKLFRAGIRALPA